MDGEDFLDEEVQSNVQRYEKMMRNKTTEYFDPETLETIVDFYIEKDKLKRALEVVYYAETLYPGLTDFMLLKAEILGLMSKYDEAVSVLKKVESFEPFNPELHLLKGDLMLHAEEFQQAEACFETALQYADERTDMLFEIAYAYQDCDIYSKAIEYFEKIIHETPTNDQAKYELAACYDMIGNFNACEMIYLGMIDDDPYSANAWYSLGVSYAKEGKHEKALSAFDYCLIIDEDYLLARFNKANELVELKRYEEALQEYHFVIEKDGPDSITYCNIAGCLERMGNIIEARDYYQKSTRLNPNLAEAWFGIGLTYEKELKMKDAMNYYKRALIMEPENTEYLLSLAECEYQLGNLEESEECYQMIIALDPELMEAWLDWSYVMFNDKREMEAIELLTEAIKVEPNCHQYYYRLTTYLYKTGKVKSALQYLELGLLINFKEHFLVFEYAPELASAIDILELIEAFRDKYEE